MLTINWSASIEVVPVVAHIHPDAIHMLLALRQFNIHEINQPPISSRQR